MKTLNKFFLALILCASAIALGYSQSEEKVSAVFLKSIQPHSDVVTSVIFPADPQFLISLSPDGSLKLNNIESDSVYASRAIVMKGAFVSIAYSLTDAGIGVNSNLFENSNIAYYQGKKVIVANANDLLIQTEIPVVENVSAMSFDNSGSQLAIGSYGKFSDTTRQNTLLGSVTLYDLKDVSKIKASQKFSSQVTSVALSKDGMSLAVGTETGVIYFWDLETDEIVSFKNRHTTSVLSMKFFSCGDYFLSADKDGVIKIWNPLQDYEMVSVTGSVWGNQSCLLSPDERGFFYAGVDNMIHYRSVTNKELLSVRIPGGRITSFALQESRNILAIGTTTNKIHFFQMAGIQTLIENPEIVVVRPKLVNYQKEDTVSVAYTNIDSGFITGYIFSDLQIKTFSANGEDVFVSAVDSTEKMKSNSSRKFQVKFRTNYVLNPDTANIILTSTDVACNSSTKNIQLVYHSLDEIDTIPPRIIILSSEQIFGERTYDETSLDSENVLGLVIDESVVTEVFVDTFRSILTKATKEEIKKAGMHGFGVRFSQTIRLQPGLNIIPILAKDTSGNFATDTIWIQRIMAGDTNKTLRDSLSGKNNGTSGDSSFSKDLSNKQNRNNEEGEENENDNTNDSVRSKGRFHSTVVDTSNGFDTRKIKRPKSDIWGVVVGVSTYDDDNNMFRRKTDYFSKSTRFAFKDAISFSDFLKSKQGGSVPDEQIAVLINERATSSRINKQLEDVFRSADEDDIVIVFFSMHCVPSSDGENLMFLTYDSDPMNFMETSLTNLDIERVTRDTKAQKTIFICDVYRDGAGLALRQGLESSMDFLFSNLFSNIDSASVFLGSSSIEISNEGKEWNDHGAFTKVLLDGLSGTADVNHDGNVSVGEIQEYLTKTVPMETLSQQHPEFNGTLNKNFILSKQK
ncbi:MAG: hypothetical protein KGZ58_04345 [Ignavibacteriales bacterium]|nr:hypothetical protein [Ignavibacteriales bacterium]